MTTAPPTSGPLYTPAAFQAEVDALHDSTNAPEDSILLTSTLRAKLTAFISADPAPRRSPAEILQNYRQMRRRALISQIHDEVERLTDTCERSPSISVPRDLPGLLPPYSQRQQRLRSASPLHSLQHDASTYLKECFFQQRTPQRRPKDTCIAHTVGSIHESYAYVATFGQESPSTVVKESRVAMRSSLQDLKEAVVYSNSSASVPCVRNVAAGRVLDPLEFMYINGVFYASPFPPTSEMVDFVLTTATLLDDPIAPANLHKYIAPLDDTLLCDVALQFDAASGCYCHFGTRAQHIFALYDATGIPKHVKERGVQRVARLFAEAKPSVACDACGVAPSTAMRYFDDDTPFHPTMLCAFCHMRMLEDYAPKGDDPSVVIERGAESG